MTHHRVKEGSFGHIWGLWGKNLHYSGRERERERQASFTRDIVEDMQAQGIGKGLKKENNKLFLLIS